MRAARVVIACVMASVAAGAAQNARVRVPWIPSAERQALLDLYSSTNGASWTHTTNWNAAAGTECTWFGVTCDGGGTTVQQLVLGDNNLVGTLPTTLGSLTNLDNLTLSGNHLTGSIPGSLGSLTNLQYLSLWGNRLTGPIPAELGNLVNLVGFYLEENQLSGPIPSQLGKLVNLQGLYLDTNQLTGSIPAELGNLANLVDLHLEDNQLSGPIPFQLGKLVNLQGLYLNINQLTGSIPTTFGNLTNLQYLELNGNMLSGAIPTSLESLTKLVAGRSDLGYNALYSTDAALTAFLNTVQSGGDWQSTQTVAPTGVAADTATSTSVALTWTPIAYTGDTGGYRAHYSTSPGGPYTAGGITTNKSASSILVNGLNSSTLYYFVVRTVTGPTSRNHNTVTSDPSAESHATTSVGTTPGNVVWVPVASHNPGKSSSQWRSDLGLLNTGTVTANVEIRFYGSGGVVSNTAYVSPNVQSILTDVVGQVGGAGSGALEILSDQPLKVTARSYNQVPSDASCNAGGTQGQDYPVVVTSDGLTATQSAYLPGLSEDPSTRCNIGVVNTGTEVATVLVELFNGAGTELTEYPVTLNPGEWKQETQPFFAKAGQTAMGRGYAKITVQSGLGVFGFASVVDGVTNDPTTVAMQR